jgi:hypothetical protein
VVHGAEEAAEEAALAEEAGFEALRRWAGVDDEEPRVDYMLQEEITDNAYLSVRAFLPPLRLGSRFPAAPVESSRVSPLHRPREDELTHPAGTSRSNLAAALALLSRWRLSKP